MPFTGYYEHYVDDKNRLSIPSSIRAAMDPERHGKRFYIVPGSKGTLWLYPEKVFDRVTERIETELIPDTDQTAFDQAYFPMVELVEMDTAGRIVLPAKTMAMAGLAKEVTICGVRDHVEIVNRADFDRRKDELWRNFAEVQRRARDALVRTRRQTGAEPEMS